MYRTVFKSESPECSDIDARLKAGSHLRMIQSYQFIVALVVTQRILSYTRPILLLKNDTHYKIYPDDILLLDAITKKHIDTNNVCVCVCGKEGWATND